MAPKKSQSRSQSAAVIPFAYCEGSPSWTPDAYLADADLHARAEAQLAESNDLQGAIATSFALRRTDAYVYHAIAAVTLRQAQQAVALGAAHGQHTWYYDEPEPDPALAVVAPGSRPQPRASRPRPPPPRPDVDAYLSIFRPSNAAATALRNLAANAKKGSIRAETGAYLASKRYIHPSLDHLTRIPRLRPSPSPSPSKPSNPSSSPPPPPPPPANPYLTFLSWASRDLEWAGPNPSSARAPPGSTSHAALPILMHHFGCACPSHEALEILRLLADGREILDVGSGGGYWTRMLRDYHAFHAPKSKSTSKSRSKSQSQSQSEAPVPPLPVVTPVDSAQSSWRTNWVRDTLIADGAAYLRTTRAGAEDAVLLLVYPIVGGGVGGGTEGGFTRGMLDAYDGDTVAVVGTQSHNGYTGFRNMTMDEFMARERGREWVKVVQVPLPSFPGKDEALYVFQRGSRAQALAREEKPGAREPTDHQATSDS